MALIGDTGNGTTLAFGTQTLTLAIDNVDCPAITGEMLEVSTLATTGQKEFIATDLKDTGEGSAEFVFVTSANAPSVLAAAETITITFPQRTGETGAATYVGTGVITEFKLPTLQNGVIQKGSIKWKFDGDTGPTYTKATTS